MADFEVKIMPIRVMPHPNADRLELAAVGDYRSIVGKGDFHDGDMAAYIPSGTVIPDDVLEELGLTGKLSGSRKNRLKEARFRGILSEGLVYPLSGNRLKDENVGEGDEVAELLGVVKWEPAIPATMGGQVMVPRPDPENSDRLAGSVTLGYDIENYKKHNRMLEDGEEVSLTEKVHGTWCSIGYHRATGHMVTSKGMSGRGLVLKDNEVNDNNVYVKRSRLFREKFDRFRDLLQVHEDAGIQRDSAVAVYLLGEIYGKGVQDLQYGTSEPEYALFDVYVGSPGIGRYLTRDEYSAIAEEADIPMVAELYRGPFSKEVMLEHSKGQTVVGKGANVREGVVIRAVPERRDPRHGRVILKSVNEKYLLRKQGTEYN